jgi:hypothetical protein
MATYTSYPQLQLADAIAQPSDATYGRTLTVLFDSTNIYLTSDGYFAMPDMTTQYPVVVRITGATIESNPSGYEDFSITQPGECITGTLHFTTFTNAQIIDGYKIYLSDSYGVVEVKEALPVNLLDDGYAAHNPYVQFTAYGSGIFLFQTTIKDAYNNSVDPGYGQYELTYGAPFQIGLKTAPDKIYIGNSKDLLHAADGVVDEVLITSATATKSRTRVLAGSYDVSVGATSPVSNEPDAKTLVLLHMDDNSQDIIDNIRDPLYSANLSDSTLATIVSLRNNQTDFINYVNSLDITGTIVDYSIDTRPLSAQLFDLVSAIDGTVNSANYYQLSGLYYPSEITVNANFQYAAVFSGETYTIEKPGLINDDQGSIEVWIAPLANLLGDFNRRVYLDSINHATLGSDGSFTSFTANLIKLPNNIVAQQINSITLAGSAGASNTFDFSSSSFLSADGTTITLTQKLPNNNTAVVVDYIPLSTSNDRITLFKDEDSNLIFSISASGVLYQTSTDISSWQRNEWHRVMITWTTNDKHSLDHLNLYVDGTETTIIKFGEGFLFNTFVFNQEFQTSVNTQIIPQNIQFAGDLDQLYVGTDFLGEQQAFCRMANLRVSFIERQPTIDARGFKIDSDFDGGPSSATPETQDTFTSYLENFNPMDGFITNFATIQDPTSGAHDLKIVIRDYFNLVRGVDNGLIERLLRELIRIIQPAEARTRVLIETNE